MIRPLDDTPPIAANEAAPRSAVLHGERLVIRADGDARIGMGHVMRCLALAQSWIAAGGIVRLASAALHPTIAERYHDDGVEVVLREGWEAADLVDEAAAVVADGQGISDDLLAAIAVSDTVLAIIDDMGHRPHYPGALVVNHHLHASAGLYAGKTDARLCLGPSWALLRREFRTAPQRPAAAEAVARLLILMGGADPQGHSTTALDAVARAAEALTGEPEIVLVVGAANPAIDALQRRAAALPVRIDVRHDVRDMAGLLHSADLAVSAAGSTVLEMAALGVPMIIGAQNESELGPAAALSRAGGAIDIGPLAGLDPKVLGDTVLDLATDGARRADLAARARALVDGNGADRVAAAIAAAVQRQRGIS